MAQAKRSTGERLAVVRRVAELAASRPLGGTRERLARLAGVTDAVRHGRAGNRRWGYQMLGRKGGLANARHNLEQLRRMAPMAHRLALIAIERKMARKRWEREHPLGPPDGPPA